MSNTQNITAADIDKIRREVHQMAMDPKKLDWNDPCYLEYLRDCEKRNRAEDQASQQNHKGDFDIRPNDGYWPGGPNPTISKSEPAMWSMQSRMSERTPSSLSHTSTSSSYADEQQIASAFSSHASIPGSNSSYGTITPSASLSTLGNSTRPLGRPLTRVTGLQGPGVPGHDPNATFTESFQARYPDVVAHEAERVKLRKEYPNGLGPQGTVIIDKLGRPI